MHSDRYSAASDVVFSDQQHALFRDSNEGTATVGSVRHVKISVIIRITWTNKIHYFILLYFNSKPLHVSSTLAAHHQEYQLCINSNLLAAASQHKGMAIPIAVYTELKSGFSTYRRYNTKTSSTISTKRQRNIGRPRKRWRDQLHLEDQGTGNTPNHSWIRWWWQSWSSWWCAARLLETCRGLLSE